MTTEIAFELRNWSVLRNKTAILGPAHFAFHEGHIYTIMGPSGIGKSSLLLTLLGYLEEGLEVSGERVYNGRFLTDGEIPSRALFIPQSLPFNPNWEVGSFLRRLPYDRGTRRAQKAKVQHVLANLGIQHREKAIVAELSGGESQRAALAQAFLLEPKLLVCDEFISAVDPAAAVDIMDLFRACVIRTQSIAILALHDVHTALRFSDEIAVLWPRDLKAQPWFLCSEEPAWRGDVIFTLICLSQWLQGLRASRSLLTLIELLHTATYFGYKSLVESVDKQFSSITLINPDGSFTPLDSQGLVAKHLERDTRLEPFRAVREKATFVGFTIYDDALNAGITFVVDIKEGNYS